jgi:hypothetical protein
MTERGRPARRVIGGIVVSAAVGLAVAGVWREPVSAAPAGAPGPAAWGDGSQAQARTPAQQKPAKNDPGAKMTEAWPDAKQVEERRAAAENLPLFKSHDPLSFTLTADFTAINKERNPATSKRFPGVLQVQGADGGTRSIPVQVSPRGHARRDARVCSAVPLRLEFAKKDVAGSVFEGQRDVKLVTNCENASDYQQYVLTEYLTYRIFGLFTPRSFRARLSRVTYVDSTRNKAPAPRYGILLENDEDLARRFEGRLIPVPNRLFSLVDQESLMWVTLLQYMIGNTDYSIMALHNIKLVQERSGVLYPVTYDFDYSGLVNATYAVADKRFNLASVRDRLYRGPCKTAKELAPFLETFGAKKDEVLTLIDQIPDMKSERRRDAREYLSDFFSIVTNPAKSKRALIDSCVKAVGM